MRFEPHGERSSQQTSHMHAPDGSELAELTYGDTALIRRMNVGLRRRKNKDFRGYLLNTVTGKWERNNADIPAGANDGTPTQPSTGQAEVAKHPRWCRMSRTTATRCCCACRSCPSPSSAWP
jgi:hypothetical protein